MPRKLDPVALEAAFQAAPNTPRSIIEQAVTAYNDIRWISRSPGSAAQKIAKLGVGESVIIESSNRRGGYLQTTTKQNARALLRDPGAEWKSTHVGFGYKATRIR